MFNHCTANSIFTFNTLSSFIDCFNGCMMVNFARKALYKGTLKTQKYNVIVTTISLLFSVFGISHKSNKTIPTFFYQYMCVTIKLEH